MIYKNKDIKAEINERGVDIGNIGANFYTKDLGTASIRISINWKGSVLDLSKTTLKPKLDLFCEDGSIFVNEPIEIVSPVNGLIQYNISKDVIKHVGKVTGKLFLTDDANSIHVVTFRFNISDSGIDSVVTKEVSVTLVDDTVRRIIQENAIQLLGDDFESRLNTDVIEHLNSNPDLFKGAKGEPGKDADTSVLDNARGSYETLDERLKSMEFFVNPSDFGASPTASWQTNRDAFQKANDVVTANGGGVINVKPGEYSLKGLTLDSNVDLILKDVTLKHPDGLAPSLISTKVTTTTISTIKDSNYININELGSSHKDCIIAIEGLGGISNTQRTELESDIDSTTLTINLVNDDGKFPKNNVIRIGDELIKYSSINNKVVTVVERGAFGTTATSHTKNDVVGLANVFYTEITKVTDNKGYLRDSIPLTANNVRVWIGSKNVKISGGKIDGNKYNGGSPSSVFGIEFPHARFCNITDVSFENCDQGAIFLNKGAQENNITNCNFKDNNVYNLQSGNKGASIWLFQNCRFNKIVNPTFYGSGWVAIYIDDRTTIADIFDKPNTDNYVINATVNFDNNPPGYNPGIIITGSSRNVVSNGYIKGPYTAVKIERGSQYLKEPEKAENNEVSSFFFDTNQPWNISAEGNRINNVVYSDKMIAAPVTEESTLIYGYSSAKGVNATFGNITFSDGSPNSPSITFKNDKDTGFIRYGENTIGVISGSEFIYTMYNTLTRIKDGYNMEFGTTTGTKLGTNPNQKIGFYGKTPIAQQTTLSNTSGYTLQQLEFEVNAIKNVLRNIGIVAQS